MATKMKHHHCCNSPAGLGIDTQTKHSLFARLDLSFGLKALGRDLTSDVSDSSSSSSRQHPSNGCDSLVALTAT
jgi:hypothetical protein